MNLCYAHKPTKKANKVIAGITVTTLPFGFMFGKRANIDLKQHCKGKKVKFI